MAEMSLSPEEFLSKLLADEHADVLREGLAWLVRELMESEVAAQAGVALHEKSPQRLARRNGYRERLWQTRVGDLELAIPRLRSGNFFPSFLEPRSRSEHALVAAQALVAEARGDYDVAATGCAAAAHWHDFGMPYEEAQALLGKGAAWWRRAERWRRQRRSWDGVRVLLCVRAP